MGVYREDLAVACARSLHNIELVWDVQRDMTSYFGDFHGDFGLGFAPRTHFIEWPRAYLIEDREQLPLGELAARSSHGMS